MPENTIKTECNRCGTCCQKGGPALHFNDLALVQNKFLHLEHLVTIRKGEPVYPLAAEKPEPAASEIIKIKGRRREWTCLFFEEKEAKCGIYMHRPLECSLLKCWDTADLENAAGKNLLSRYDILAPQDPILQYITKHDSKCALDDLALLFSILNSDHAKHQAQDELTELVQTDLAIRTQACAGFDLSLDLELFFFGRPLFKILHQFGINMEMANGVCRLFFPPSQAFTPFAGI